MPMITLTGAARILGALVPLVQPVPLLPLVPLVQPVPLVPLVQLVPLVPLVQLVRAAGRPSVR
jgi:hypothetical protein